MFPDIFSLIGAFHDAVMRDGGAILRLPGARPSE
jgi:hypothetical protein